MSTTSIEEFPYTIGYVSQLLDTSEEQVLQLCQQRDIPMHTDSNTGRVFFSLKSLEQLRQMVDNQKRTEATAAQVAKNAPPPVRQTAPAVPERPIERPVDRLNEIPRETRQTTTPTTSLERAARMSPQFVGEDNGDVSRGDISQIVETVSNAKESILQDLSMLLDDRLSGLDELVVELIRSKRENDRLKKELKKLEDTVAGFESEVSKYKPAAFGFYRRVQ